MPICKEIENYFYRYFKKHVEYEKKAGRLNKGIFPEPTCVSGFLMNVLLQFNAG